MTKLRLFLLCCMLAYSYIGCAPSREVTSELAAPWATGTRRAEPAVWAEDGSSAACRNDSDCPAGELCKPGRDRCLSAYPDPRILSVKPSEKEDCWLVDLYFSYHSAQLAGEANRWLQYNIRCLRTRDTLGLVLRGHAAGRGRGTDALAIERSKAVKQVLLKAGLAMPIKIRGPGRSHPTPLPRGEKDYEYARRVEFWAL